MNDRDVSGQSSSPPPSVVPVELLERVGGGLRAIEVGEAVAAFILAHMMM